MSLPDKFYLKRVHGSYDYEVFKGDDGKYYCHKIGGDEEDSYSFGPYDDKSIELWVENGLYTIEPIASECNGVDRDGKPFNFTEADLKPFMRVKTADRGVWIVAPNQHKRDHHGDLALVSESGWNTFYIDCLDNNQITEAYKAVEVYDLPDYNRDMLDPQSTGNLIWKRKEQEAAKTNPMATRLEFFQQHIDAVKENLESLQKGYEELKADVFKADIKCGGNV